jgi:glutamate racemase
MNNDAIGVFDSGIGGLTCVKELNRLMPNENIIYFGDTARIPYGTRSKDTIAKYAAQDIAFIRKHNVKMIIAACGTVSSVIGNNQTLVTDMPFTGVLLPAVQAACGATRNRKVGVIGTPATIKSGGYGKAIRNIRPDIQVIGNSCPLLVPLAENGFTQRDNQITRLVLEQYLAPIKKENIDTLILGCTHYPLFREAIEDFMGSETTIISAGAEAAKYACAVLTEKELLTDREEKGTNTFYSSDSTELFEEHVRTFLGEQPDGKILKVDIDELTAL